MSKWLGHASQEHEMYCYDLEVMGSKALVGLNLGCIILLSKLYLNLKYQFSVHLFNCAYEITSDLSDNVVAHFY